MKLVSVIVPAYNRERTITATLRSVLSQTYREIEVLVVDDGSTDGTAERVDALSDPRISLIRAGHSGAAAARNEGLRKAAGDFIQYLDSDDLLNPEKIERQVALLADHDQHASICATVHFTDGEDPMEKSPGEYERGFLRDYPDPVDFLVRIGGGYSENGSMVSSNSWLVPRTLADEAGPWNESLSADDDGEYFTRIALRSKGILFSPGSLDYYRKYPGYQSLSDTNSEERLASRLKSALLRKEALFKHTRSDAARLAVYKLIMGIVVKSYPQFPSVYRPALRALPQVSTRVTQHVGGPFTNSLARIFGWRFARHVQYLRERK